MGQLPGMTDLPPAASKELGWRVFRLLISPRSSIPLAITNLLLSGLFALLLWNALPHKSLLAWLLVAAAFGAIELALRLIAAARATHLQDLRPWLLAVGLVDACIGLLWLYAAVTFFPAADSALQFFFLFVLGAAALTTIVYQHYHLPASFARIGLALPVAAFHFLYVVAPLRELQAFIIACVWVTLIWLAVRLHRAMRHRLTLTINRDALLQKVAQSAHELDAIRAANAKSRDLAEQANLAKSRFLAHSSHDLRQPLHAISLLLETVDEDQLDPQTGHVFARVRQSVEMLAKLFDSLLDVTLLDTGQMEVDESVFAVDDVLGEVALDFAAVAQANSVTIKVEKNGHYICADQTILRRMLQNLVANAIRHASASDVTLRTRPEDNTLRIEVEDTGAGIAPDDQQRIFDEFTRLSDSSDGKSVGGLGLGLAIVNRLARLTGAQVGLISELDKGSLFHIGPFEILATPESPAAARVVPTLDLTNIGIAVVDDDRDTLKATGQLLGKWGLTVSLYEDGSAAKMPRPNILVCDYELGGDTTGIDVIRKVRERHGVRVPALLISGNASHELAVEAQREGLPLLHKPVRPVQLKSAILTLLGGTSPKAPP